MRHVIYWLTVLVVALILVVALLLFVDSRDRGAVATRAPGHDAPAGRAVT